ncbi:T9SS type A sorting domain-containing protein, partial [bacterium]|nr:T9SS type A sorting domain-containing protein [bacterium]
LDGLDGIVMDAQGRIYFSSWQTNSVHRYDADLTTLEVFSSGHDAPADISFNHDETILQVVNFNRNTVDFIAVPSESAVEREQVFDYQVYPCYPNPFNSTTTLKFSLTNPMRVNVTAYDIKGRTIGVLLDDTMYAGTHELDVKGDNWASGTYFLQLRADNMQSVSRITLLK